MTTSETDQADAGSRLRAGMSAGDLEAVGASLAADVVLHSPITSHSFNGRPGVVALLADVLDVLDSFDYVIDTPFEDGRVLATKSRLGGREYDLVEVVRYDANGLVCDISVQVRPLAGTVALLAALAPRVALRIHGRGRARLLRLATAPLPALARGLDHVGYQLAGPWSA